MRFNLAVIDPPGFRYAHFLFDSVSFLRGALADLGHEVTVRRNTLERDRINILCGVHLLGSFAEVDGFLRSDAPYVVLQTELVQPEGINGERSSRLSRVVLPLLRGAVAVWDSSQQNIDTLGKLGVSADMLHFGYTDAVVAPPLDVPRDIDFFFCGSLTPHRQAILGRLSELGYTVEVRFDDAAFFRNELMARSQVLVSLRQSRESGHLPAARILHGVANGCLVAGEKGDPCPTVDDLFSAAPDDDVVEHLRRVRSDPRRHEKAAEFNRRLKARPMSALIQPLIERLAERRKSAA